MISEKLAIGKPPNMIPSLPMYLIIVRRSTWLNDDTEITLFLLLLFLIMIIIT